MPYEKTATCICALALGQATNFSLKHGIRESKYWAVIGEFLSFLAARSLGPVASFLRTQSPEGIESIRRAIKKEIFTGGLCGQIDADTRLKIAGLWVKSSMDIDSKVIAFWNSDLDELCITRERIQTFSKLGFGYPTSNSPMAISEYAFLIRASIYAHGENPTLDQVTWVFSFMKLSVKDFDNAMVSILSS